MISDVLFDAIVEIEWYQRAFPDVYQEFQEDLTLLKDAMRTLQVKLDTPGLHPLAKKRKAMSQGV